MNRLAIIGAVIAILGLAGLAVPYFTTQKTEEVAHIGDLKIQNTEHQTHTIPPLLSGGALLIGLGLMGLGLYKKA